MVKKKNKSLGVRSVWEARLWWDCRITTVTATTGIMDFPGKKESRLSDWTLWKEILLLNTDLNGTDTF